MLKKYSPKNNKEVPKLFSVLADQAFMSITTLLTTVVLARVYSKTSYADLVLLFSITLFILGFQSAIISKPYAINLNDFNQNKSQESYYQFNLNLKLLLTIGIVLIFPILYYFAFDTWNSTKFSFFLIYIITHSSYFYVRETLLSERKTKKNLVYGIWCTLSLITVLSTILIYKIQDIRIFLGLASIIYGFITLIYIFKNYKKTIPFRHRLRDFWSANWKVGKWLLGSNFLFHISSNVYPWLLLYITSKDKIAIFGVLMSIASLVNPLLTALSSYLLPLFVKINNNHKRIGTNVNKWVFLFALMAFILVLFGIFGGQHIIDLLFGEKYKDLGIIVIYPFIVQAINVTFQPFKIALNAIKRTDINFWVLIPRSIISVLAGYYFITKFGVIGVFYTMLIENLFYQTCYFLVYRRIINSNSRHE